MDLNHVSSTSTVTESIRMKFSLTTSNGSVNDPADQIVDIIFACQVQQILGTETEFETIVYTLNDEQLKVGLCTDIDMGLV